MVNMKISLTMFFAVGDEEALYSQQKERLGADCGSDHELLVANQAEIEESRENH